LRIFIDLKVDKILLNHGKVVIYMRFLKCEKGMALPLVLVILVIMVLLGTALWQYSLSELKQVVIAEDQARAYYVARAGAESLARHIRLNPSVIDDILNETNETLSGIVTMETENLGEAGDMSVSIKRLDEEKLEVTGIGVTNGIQQTVTIVLELKEFPAPDAVVVTTGTQHVDFHQNMTVEGSIIAGGEITLPNSYDTSTYTATPEFQFPEDYFKRVVVPDGPYDHVEEGILKITKHMVPYEIPNGQIYEMDKLIVEGDGILRFYAEPGSTTILVVTNLDLKNKSIIEIEGTGTVQIYIREVASMDTPKIVFPGGAQLHFYLAEGCEVVLNGNVQFNGLFYGPYGTSVKMGSNTSVTGAMIVEQLSGMGGNNKIGAAGTALTYYAGFGDLDFLPIVNMLYWKP